MAIKKGKVPIDPNYLKVDKRCFLNTKLINVEIPAVKVNPADHKK